MSASTSRQTSKLQPRRSLSPEYDRASASEARQRQRPLGARLRDLYADVVQEPAPEDFLAILKRADRQARRR